MKSFFIKIVILVTIFSHNASAAAEVENIDYLKLAARLVHDGAYDKAETVLEKVEEDKRESKKFFLVNGLLQLYQQNFASSEGYFKKAIQLDPDDRFLKIYLAQSYFGLKHYQKTLDSLASVQGLADSIASTFIIRSKALWELGQQQAAWSTLNRARENFPAEQRFLQMQIEWLAELKLYSQIKELISALAVQDAYGHETLMFGASTLRRYGEFGLAISFLEMLRIKHPDQDIITAELALNYLSKGNTYTAAKIFADLSLHHPQYAYEAAELLRQSGYYEEALHYNASVLDQLKKMKQKLAILIALQEFELSVAIETDLKRLGGLDEDIRYALAYSYFQLGDFEKTDQYLSTINTPKLFKKAIVLRESMLRCKDKIEACMEAS